MRRKFDFLGTRMKTITVPLIRNRERGINKQGKTNIIQSINKYIETPKEKPIRDIIIELRKSNQSSQLHNIFNNHF